MARITNDQSSIFKLPIVNFPEITKSGSPESEETLERVSSASPIVTTFSMLTTQSEGTRTTKPPIVMLTSSVAGRLTTVASRRSESDIRHGYVCLAASEIL